ncbi:LLM class flavin-dependent oxidoreductase [Lentibacillus sp. Marseille-P4043]|uniref:LLM class flavin-dependent oxidoreductase n=1 Tax=Lentibacillus sp. Marseille-P4043 TaxID=2040293 RepID=UPI000D0B0385|nr:LLM class flavin-dependent oxidoreductase [Lentibacillus sp. Marseille-P4043]
MTKHIPLNVLDLVSVSEGRTVSDAIDASMETAQLADKLGYKRMWFAEHHNGTYLASMATSVLITRAAAMTDRIRVGSGGIMLPNHAPLQVAEDFGTLAQMFPNRIDLGLGRAPGTDGLTAQLLSRSGAEPQDFANSIYDLIGWFSDEGQAHSVPGVTSGVGTGTKVPMWVLGSSVNGASIAGQLGLPFSLATHFSPDDFEKKLDLYRSSFNSTAPTSLIDKPYAMAGINVVVAPTDEEAQSIWTTTQRMILDVRTGNRRPLQPPVAPEDMGSDQERAFAESMLNVKAVGSPETVRKELEDFVERSGVDELIVMTYAYDPEDKFRSMKLLADLWF